MAAARKTTETVLRCCPTSARALERSPQGILPRDAAPAPSLFPRHLQSDRRLASCQRQRTSPWHGLVLATPPPEFDFWSVAAPKGCLEEHEERGVHVLDMRHHHGNQSRPTVRWSLRTNPGGLKQQAHTHQPRLRRRIHLPRTAPPAHTAVSKMGEGPEG